MKENSKKVFANYRSIRVSRLSTDQVGLSNNNPHWNLGFRFLFFPDLIQVLRDLKMTHQIGIRNTLHEERFYVDGALVIASSLRNTEIKRILSVWSLEAFLRLLGRSREMTRGPVTETASAQHGLDRQNTLFNTKMQMHRHGGSHLDSYD